MVSEIFTDFITTTGMDLFFGLPPDFTVYFLSFLFAVFFAIVAGVASGRPMAALGAFFGSLFIFAIIGSFPIWIIGMGIVILIFVFYYGGDGGNGGGN